MDNWKPNGSSESIGFEPSTSGAVNGIQECRESYDVEEKVESKDPIAVRKVQKADREKLRRGRVNEHFIGLGCTLDPVRPKNDKATILTDTIHILKELTSEVNKLKAEYTALSEESLELVQEKNELRGEKASLKSDINGLYAEYQHKLRPLFPWSPFGQSPLTRSPNLFPMNPSMQSCSIYFPYGAPASAPIVQPASYLREQHLGKYEDVSDVATDLELKPPGTSSPEDNVTGERIGNKEKYH